MLALANLGDNTVSGAGSLKALKSGVQRLVLTDAYFCHLLFPPFAANRAKVFYILSMYYMIIPLYIG